MAKSAGSTDAFGRVSVWADTLSVNNKKPIKYNSVLILIFWVMVKDGKITAFCLKSC